jgi:uncharacterized protein (DUF2267 family)
VHEPPRDAPETELELQQRLLASIQAASELPPEVSAGDAFSAVMCLLAQRLSAGEARDLVLGLPRSLRPLVGRCALHGATEVATFDAGGLVTRVAAHLSTGEPQAHTIVRAVFRAVKDALPAEQVHQTAGQLPAELRALWTDA